MKTTIFAKSSRLVALLAIAGFCVSCADKFDFETARDPKAEEKEQYNNRFSDIVGDIDPEHNWSTAQSVGVQVAIDMPGTHYLRIFSADPRKDANAFLLGKFTVQGGKFEDISFDFPNSFNQLCAVLDYGYNSQYQMVDVVKDGVTVIDFADIEVVRAANRPGTRAEGEIFTFRGDKDEYYVTSMPEGLPEVSTYQVYKEHKSYYVSESTTEVNAWEGNCDIYFPEGTYTISKFAVRNTTNVYLMPGADVTFTNGLNQNYTENVWTVNSGAKMTVKGELSYNFMLFNRGIIVTDKLGLYAKNLLYNEGKLTVNGDANINNDNCELVNKGYFKAANLTVAGSSHFLNSCEAIISGDTKVNSDNATWRNNGSFTTKNFTFTAISEDISNNCYMKVDNMFKIILANGTGTFHVGNGGRVATKYFELGIGRIKMADNSIIKCSESAVMGITNDYATRSYGIYGPKSGQAVFSSPVIKWGTVREYNTDPARNNFCATYGGHLYVSVPSIDDHFPLEYLGEKPTYYVFDEQSEDEDDDVTIGVMANEPSVLANCSKTYTGDPTKKPINDSERFFPWVIACEDLGNTATSDFDFNDVVFAVTIERVNDAINASVQPLAAGGTMAAYIMYKDVNGKFIPVEHPTNSNKTEIHSWLADVEGAPVTTMLNTGDNNIDIDMVAKAVVVLDPEFTSMSDFSDYFGVKIVKNGEEFSTTTDGYTPTIVNENDLINNKEYNDAAAPKMICVADVPSWCWMKERKPIVTGYNLFPTWAANCRSAEAWYTSPSVPANVVTRVTKNTGTSGNSENSGNGENSGNTENSGNSGSTTQTETPNGYVVKVNGQEVTELSLGFNETKTITVWAKYPTQQSEDVTSSATIEKYSGGDALIINNKTVSGNLAKVLDGDPSYTFEKLTGDYNNANEISGDNSVAVKVGVNSKLIKTYKAAATTSVSGSFAVKIAGVIVATIPVTVTPETVDDTNRTKTEDVNVTWSWTGSGSPNLSNTAKTQDFTASASGTLTATQAGSNKTQTWTVTVNTTGGGDDTPSEEVVLWEGTPTQGSLHGVIALSADAIATIKAASSNQTIYFYNNEWDDIFKYDDWNCMYSYSYSNGTVKGISVSSLPSDWDGKFYSQSKKTYKVTIK